MIVIVGPDKVGKGALAKALLAAQPKRYYYHHTRPKDTDMYLYFMRYFATCDPRAVVDRCHWCEVAYGETYRGGSSLSDHQFRLLELMLVHHEAQVVYLYDDLDSLTQRWADYKEPFDPSKAAKLMEVYDRLMATSPVPVIKLRLPKAVDLDSEKLLPSLADQLGLDVLPQPHEIPTGRGFGKQRQHVMFLGEALSEPESGGIQLPWSRGYSSDFLWGHLNAIEFDWTQAYFTNADAFTSKHDFNSFCARQFTTKIVCLGTHAKTLANTTTRPVLALEHPHYQRRFRSSDPGWVDKLRRFLA